MTDTPGLPARTEAPQRIVQLRAAEIFERLPAYNQTPGGVFLKLKTVRVRRSRPSALALALALMLTMLFV